MREFFSIYQSELLWTVITLVTLVIFRFIGNKTVRRIEKVNNFVKARALLISKYTSILLTFLGVAALTFIWGVNLREIGVLFSSVFAVIGVALFAQWSIISNITAGVILFFSFPFKIGDRIKIMDKEIMDNEQEGPTPYTIEDIRAFHVHLRKDNGELLTYPNNMMLQKGVTLIHTFDGSEEI